jgi:hypothetical protein
MIKKKDVFSIEIEYPYQTLIKKDKKYSVVAIYYKGKNLEKDSITLDRRNSLIEACEVFEQIKKEMEEYFTSEQ